MPSWRHFTIHEHDATRQKKELLQESCADLSSPCLGDNAFNQTSPIPTVIGQSIAMTCDTKLRPLIKPVQGVIAFEHRSLVVLGLGLVLSLGLVL